MLEQHRLSVAQILLTFGDTEERRRYLNARNTLGTLLKLGAVPVINENDTVATAEIRYGDNDRLAARVAQMISADCLVLLSDVDGLYTADPTRDPTAQFIPEVHAHHAGDRAHGGRRGLGGRLGRHGDQDRRGQDRSGGRLPHVRGARAGAASASAASKQGARCSWFYPAATPATVRKQWIAGALQAGGRDCTSMKAPLPRSAAARACCRRASHASAASSSAAMR